MDDDTRMIVSARRVASGEELSRSFINVKAYIFAKLVSEILESYPDVDVSTVRLEEESHTFPGTRELGMDFRVRARRGWKS